ncbi:hypothetical protein A2837_01580 [Candidatus Kaiserbacteria bacterium RIFCSPHIGHO2_01_FULL_46_22]|uniref:CARDB domain-containing protein n=1 Tax=Candidatus Kaiserbacteria bacterium RIFCSPHIGHO2_01_FULL_46_22 TaxID=1798475 RepID=A0A1F6BY58_9BACT|nr:MAG: hypothetical protein A2837_01580 [Candidatus Kaiserbacteria bacterium RIFCSPHIGHO2_01_FULL_46_22]
MNDQIEKKDDLLLKEDELKAGWTLSNVLAIVGFVVLVILLAWLAIQFVRMIPSAWNSLANVFNDNQRALEERTSDDESDETDETTDEEDDGVVVVDGGEDLIDDEEDSEEEESPIATSTPGTSTPTVTPKPVTPQYRTVTTYVVPTSNPNGYTDLEISLVAVGKMTSGERFIPTAYLEAEEQSAIQFRVKNLGTKTSGNWHFKAELPNGDDFKSNVQQPLKPGEMATLTIAFVTDNDDGSHKFNVSVYTNGDTNTANNGFTATVNVR